MDQARFEYDPYALEVRRNPLPFYKELRANHPGYYVEKYDMFVFTRYQDIIDLLSITDENVFVGTEQTLPPPSMIAHRNNGAPAFVSTNPMGPGAMLPSPQYEQMRLAQIRPLQPTSVQAIQGLVRDLAVEQLDTLLPRGTFDLMWDYGGMVCAAVTCHLFDIPFSEANAVRESVNFMAAYSDDIEGVDTPGMFEVFKRFIFPAIDRRRKAGADGRVPLIDGLINYRVPEDGRALNDEEVYNQLVGAFVGNTETPPRPTAQGLLALARHPEQLAEIRADLDANIPIAVEEILRTCVSNQWAVRTAHKDVTVCGIPIKAGQRIMFSAFSANRDEEEFGPSVEQFIWNRKAKRILTFGYGNHHCIGNHISRMQIRTLIREFLARVDAYEFDLDKAEHSTSYFHWGWSKLPVIIKH